MEVSPHSNIHPNARIADNVTIEPFASIHANVSIGEGSLISSNVVIYSGVTIGKNCKIFPGAVIGAEPQDLKYGGENTVVEIGDNVIIRECCTINKGTKASGKTIVESNCLLMAYVHIAHDCHVKNNCIIANGVNLAGHVVINDNVILGGLTLVQQFVRIGEHSYVSGGCKVRKDIPPFVKAARDPVSYVGINRIGLERKNFERIAIHRIQDIYRILYVKGWHITKAIEYIKSQLPDSQEKTEILDFVLKSERGLMKGFNSLSDSNGDYSV